MARHFAWIATRSPGRNRKRPESRAGWAVPARLQPAVVGA